MTVDQQKIREVKVKHDREWLTIDGVGGVGIGTLSDKSIGIINSIGESNQNIQNKIPSKIEGVKVEFRESGEFKAL